MIRARAMNIAGWALLLRRDAAALRRTPAPLTGYFAGRG
jgi:hypothetical protein